MGLCRNDVILYRSFSLIESFSSIFWEMLKTRSLLFYLLTCGATRTANELVTPLIPCYSGYMQDHHQPFKDFFDILTETQLGPLTRTFR